MTTVKIPSLKEIIALMVRVNNDCRASNESVVSFHDIEYYAQQIDNITDCGEQIAVELVTKVARLQLIKDSAYCMSTDQLDDWYEEHVGYRLSEDEPSLVGLPKHAEAIAEMMVLQQWGLDSDPSVHEAMLELLKF